MQLKKGWEHILGGPIFDQRTLLNGNPIYEKYTDEQKAEIDRAIPLIIADLLTSDNKCNPTDEQIHKRLGHIIGEPQRGISRPDPKLICAILDAESDEDSDTEEGEKEGGAPESPERKGMGSSRSVQPLELQHVMFWRAGYYTFGAYKEAMIHKANQIEEMRLQKNAAIQSAVDEKARKREAVNEARAKKKEDKAVENQQKKDTKAAERASKKAKKEEEKKKKDTAAAVSTPQSKLKTKSKSNVAAPPNLFECKSCGATETDLLKVVQDWSKCDHGCSTDHRWCGQCKAQMKAHFNSKHRRTST
jgi:hypothetical protein